MNQRPQPYAYVYLAVIIIAAIILIPLIWRLLTGVLRFVIIAAVIVFCFLGAYYLVSGRRS